MSTFTHQVPALLSELPPAEQQLEVGQATAKLFEFFFDQGVHDADTAQGMMKGIAIHIAASTITTANMQETILIFQRIFYQYFKATFKDEMAHRNLQQFRIQKGARPYHVENKR